MPKPPLPREWAKALVDEKPVELWDGSSRTDAFKAISCRRGVDETTTIVFAGNMTSRRQALKRRRFRHRPRKREVFVQESACDEYFRYFVSNAYAPFQSSGGGVSM